MKKPYHILDSANEQRVSPDELTRLLSQNAQLMLPLVELIEQCQGAVDEVIEVTGHAAIQAVLEPSAQQVTGGELAQPGQSPFGGWIQAPFDSRPKQQENQRHEEQSNRIVYSMCDDSVFRFFIRCEAGEYRK